jgi:hypothetical protein
MSYVPVQPQPSCGLAWLEATTVVNQCDGREASNVIIDVETPLSLTDLDGLFIERIDALISEGNAKRKARETKESLMPVQAVANTIFPQHTYERHGSPAFYDVYLERVLPRMRTGDFGRYFDRLVEYPHSKVDKQTQQPLAIKPLPDLITRMKQNLRTQAFNNAYEINVYDPVRDARNTRTPCLSFLSFKFSSGRKRRLLLTAMYRNHYYISRLLGNLIGLARLMAFVAAETNVAIGSLTVVSTHAMVDTFVSKKRMSSLLSDCHGAMSSWSKKANRTA